MSHQITQCVETGMSEVDMFLLGIASVLIITLVELVQSRKRQDAIAAHHIKEMRSLYAENHALENNAQQMVTGGLQ